MKMLQKLREQTKERKILRNSVIESKTSEE